MISIKNLIKNYGEKEVLKGINIDVAEGEIYGFIGHNGSGKSTTMNILAGLMNFQSGQCKINNKEVQKGKSMLFKELGYLPEEPRFYLYMNSWEYLEFIGTMGGKTLKECKARSLELLEMVDLKNDSKRAIGEYSRGMKQRLGLAVAMYHNPKTLLLDEPSSALDPIGRKDVVNIIEELKKQGKTIFLSTHILGDVERVCDRIGILHGGKIVVEDQLDTILSEYIQPIYDVEFDEIPSDEYINKLKLMPFVKYVENSEKMISVTVGNPETDGKEVLNFISASGGSFLSIKLRRSSLEDIYIRVVNHGE